MPLNKETKPKQYCLIPNESYNLRPEKEPLGEKWKQTSKELHPVLSDMEVFFVRVLGIVFDRPQTIREPRIYQINIRGEVYKRTREHLKPRHDHKSTQHIGNYSKIGNTISTTSYKHNSRGRDDNTNHKHYLAEKKKTLFNLTTPEKENLLQSQTLGYLKDTDNNQHL